MTNKEILDTYVKGLYQFKLEQGDNEQDFSPLMPFLLLDIMYQTYTKGVKDIPCAFRMRKWKNNWYDAYHSFNQWFFSMFNTDQIDYINDKMQAFEDFIHTEAVMLETQISNGCKVLEFNEQKRVVAILMCELLTELAQSYWGRTYTVNGEPMINCRIREIQKNIAEFREHYNVGSNEIDVNILPATRHASDNLCRKVKSWFYEN